MRWSVASLFVALVLVVLPGRADGAPTQAAERPSITAPANRSVVHGGTQLEVAGFGCKPGEQVVITISEQTVGTPSAEPDGSWRTAVEVPRSTPDPTVPNGAERELGVQCGNDITRRAIVIVFDLLPRTGADVTPWALTGAVLVGVGVVLRFGARRSQHT